MHLLVVAESCKDSVYAHFRHTYWKIKLNGPLLLHICINALRPDKTDKKFVDNILNAFSS